MGCVVAPASPRLETLNSASHESLAVSQTKARELASELLNTISDGGTIALNSLNKQVRRIFADNKETLRFRCGLSTKIRRTSRSYMLYPMKNTARANGNPLAVATPRGSVL